MDGLWCPVANLAKSLKYAPACWPQSSSVKAYQNSKEKPACRDQGNLDRRGCYLAISLMCEWGGHTEVSARRLELRVSTPLASTAIIHLLTSFQNGSTIDGSGANQKEPSLVLKSLSRRVIANRHADYLKLSNMQQEKNPLIRLDGQCVTLVRATTVSVR